MSWYTNRWIQLAGGAVLGAAAVVGFLWLRGDETPTRKTFPDRAKSAYNVLDTLTYKVHRIDQRPEDSEWGLTDTHFRNRNGETYRAEWVYLGRKAGSAGNQDPLGQARRNLEHAAKNNGIVALTGNKTADPTSVAPPGSSLVCDLEPTTPQQPNALKGK